MNPFDVTILGELNMDLVLYGLPEELSPERELLANRLELTLGSSSAILAHNLSVLGTRVRFLSKVGNDTLGVLSLERLGASGTDISKVMQTQSSSGISVILAYDKFRRILTYPGTMFDLTFEDIDFNYVVSAKHFHMSSFFLHRGLMNHMQEVFRTVKSAGLSVSLDPNDDPDGHWGKQFHETLSFVDILLMNGREAQEATGKADPNAALEALAEVVPLVVVKLGSRGAIARHQGKKYSVSALSIEAIDPIGAGDSFDAGFIHARLKGNDILTCLKFANLTAAFSLTKPGGTEAFRDSEAMGRFFRDNSKHYDLAPNF